MCILFEILLSLYHLCSKISEVTAKELLHVSKSIKCAGNWLNDGAA